MNSDALTVEALMLSPYERAQIAEAIMQSLMDDAQAKGDAVGVWENWAGEQAELIGQEKVKLVDGPTLVAELYQRGRA